MSIISTWLMVFFSSPMPLLIFYLLDMSSFDGGLWKSSLIVVDSSISLCRSTSFSLTVWHSLVKCIHVKDCYVFLENWPLYYFVMHSLFLMKSNLSKFIIATFFFLLVLAWYIFFHPFTFNLYGFLYLKYRISCRQRIVGFCFLIHSDSFCFLIGMFRLLVFKVIVSVSWINIYHICYCFLFVVLVPYPIFVFYLLFLTFIFIKHFIWFNILSFLHILYFFKRNFLVIASLFAIYIYSQSKLTFKWHYMTSQVVRVLYNNKIILIPLIPCIIAVIHFNDI